MSDSLIQVGQAQAYYNIAHTRVLKYSVEMYHKGLNEHKVISAPDLNMLQNKANLQVQKWTEKWDVVYSRKKNTDEKEANLEEANNRTKEAIKALEEIDNLLLHTLSIDDKVNWESLKKRNHFPEKSPIKPEKKSYREYPHKPVKESSEFIPQFTFWEKLISSKKKRKFKSLNKNM